MGLREPGLAMANELLPGLTNFTRQARYYTVIGWMFASAGKGERLRLLESAFIQAVRSHRHTGPMPMAGVVGIDSVPRPKPGATLVPLTVGATSAIVSALDAPFYGPSAKTLGVAGTLEGKAKFEAIAGELAATVELDSSVLDGISERGIQGDLLRGLWQLCPCEPAVGRERDLLEELLFRHERRRMEVDLELESATDGPRRRTLALLLDALEPTADPERLLLSRFLEWVLRDEDYAPPEALRDEARGIAMLALRWCVRYALEIAWVSFGRIIAEYSAAGGGVDPIVDWVLGEAGGAGEWCPGSSERMERVVSEWERTPGAEMAGIDSASMRLASSELAAATLTAATVLAVLATRARELSGSAIGTFLTSVGHGGSRCRSWRLA